jgi:hypothetical protein
MSSTATFNIHAGICQVNGHVSQKTNRGWERVPSPDSRLCDSMNTNQSLFDKPIIFEVITNPKPRNSVALLITRRFYAPSRF